ncbi:MAG: hypothetical protein C0402_05875 [Thermodesulfovibrio sp.]|nr:hypothetical protein [Thermodesulfovibrio sp.]
MTGKKIHILIVDDQPESRRLLRVIFERHGCYVSEAVDGQDGIQQARRERPDVIISDALMPRMDGFQMLMEVKRVPETKAIPFIFFSGNYLSPQDSDLALALGASAYILKPKAPEVIWGEVQRCLSQARGCQEVGGEAIDATHIRKYGMVVAGKLEEKVAELEREVAQRRQAEIRLTALSRSLLDRLEAERRHIARELHDEVGQALTAVKLNIQALTRTPQTSGVAKIPPLVDECMSALDRAVQQVRDLSLNLRPSMLDDLGFAAAVRWFLEKTAGVSGIAYHVLGPDSRPPALLETTCFRIAQEAVTNAVRHAGPRNITVMLTGAADVLELTVRNDGAAFDVQEAFARANAGGSFGLSGMLERALLAGGTLAVTSSPGSGTLVRAVIPLPSRDA